MTTVEKRSPPRGTATEREDFHPREFAIPLEEFSDGRLSHYEITLQKKQQRRIDNANLKLNYENTVGNKVNRGYEMMQDRIKRDGTRKMMNLGDSINLGAEKSLIGTKMRLLKGEAQKELAFVKSVVGSDHLGLLDLSKKTLKDFEDESTLEFPRLNTIEEKMEDLRQEKYEYFHNKRGRKMAARFLNKDKRMLRKWFQELDFDGSGEVSVLELQDPMLSAGIFKTKEQIFRVMLNADKNDTMGLDFEEFLNALYDSKNELIDTKKLKKLQDMGNDPHGMQMETLITAERRKKIMNSIVNQMEKRMEAFEGAHSKYKRSSRKVELEKRRLREEDEAAHSRAISAQSEEREEHGHGGRSNLTTPSTAGTGAPQEGLKVLSAAARARANKNNPVFREHSKNARDLKVLEVHQTEDKKMYDSYLDSLEVVLKQKREMEDKKIEERLQDTEQGALQENTHITANFDRSNRFKVYFRSPKNPSMFGNARRAYQLSVEQADGKTHLNVLQEK